MQLSRHVAQGQARVELNFTLLLAGVDLQHVNIWIQNALRPFQIQKKKKKRKKENKKFKREKFNTRKKKKRNYEEVEENPPLFAAVFSGENLKVAEGAWPSLALAFALTLRIWSKTREERGRRRRREPKEEARPDIFFVFISSFEQQTHSHSNNQVKEEFVHRCSSC